ncbi:hypothetical protein COCCADRAFT_10497 [Bipolaris zeicola 26-R-13]|uniref:Uncharacterized protein n=1 Tax=Cochliobolus carbonum (strain 26-R-13) TaxID=930089 RepID=W6XVB2_COCC2|nr:uncharacterized protein COCCADRAFT_10497 [Bipolaris zeicola 26-R-13]EUC26704.1 hypothetical protein COCCADRAFT_10497 [Bipolaris zeicola 26-R-13]
MSRCLSNLLIRQTYIWEYVFEFMQLMQKYQVHQNPYLSRPSITPPLHYAFSTGLPNVESMRLCDFAAFVEGRVCEHVELANG